MKDRPEAFSIFKTFLMKLKHNLQK